MTEPLFIDHQEQPSAGLILQRAGISLSNFNVNPTEWLKVFELESTLQLLRSSVS